jgi:hypothetical protein
MDSIQNTKESSELIILIYKAALARDNCTLTVATVGVRLFILRPQ